ncbi:hypothetical protein DL769_011236 [Monosporascus sp. CRB-8-3]|nr:hypothetical protein DL769_011236 [Monosporascus sp. CRB-8-3]
MPTNSIFRDGFEFCHDRFYAHPGRAERVEVSTLRSMFLPRLTPEANKRLRDNYEFVQCQLKHYGVDYDKREMTGNGTNLLKKLLKEGKLDKVPGHIEQLRLQMSAEWWDQLSLEEMVDSYPEFLFKKYFLGPSGEPDHTKTTEVLAVPMPPHSHYRKGRVIDGARNVRGLHYEFGSPDALYLGWDRVAVARAASGHGAKAERQRKQEKDERDRKRKSMHSDYMRDAQRAKGKKGWSPVGRYIVDCKEIGGQWPEESKNMTLSIYETGNSDIFAANFDFGVIEGIMVLSSRKAVLDQYCAQLDREDHYDNGNDDEDDDDDDGSTQSDNEEAGQHAVGSKRKATRGRGRPPKKTKSSPTQSLEMFLQWKGRETGEGMILSEAEKGSIKFDNSKFASFTGEMNMILVGRNVPFMARKVSGTAQRDYRSWASYSQAAYERAQVSRWR